VSLFLVGWFAASANAEAKSLPTVPLAWFEEPEQHAPHWKVTLGPTFLLYSQRFTIQAEAIIPAHAKKSDRQADWHIILRVADEHGKWFEGSAYTHVEWKRVPPQIDNVMWSTNFFARPGTYHLVLLVYDATTEKHYLWRKSVHVERPDTLPELDRDLPMVEFINAGRMRAPLGEFLPVHSQKPVRIDVVLNLTGELQLGLHDDMFSWVRQSYVEGTLHGATGVFSQLKPDHGCVRVSAVDILHLDVTLDRTLANPESDWRNVHDSIIKNRDTSQVDVRTLAGRTKAREFFHRFLDRVISDNTGCGTDSGHIQRAVVVVSDSLVFPKGTDTEPVAPANEQAARFFHVRISPEHRPADDQVGHMLDPLHPRRFNVTSPKQLRQAVAEIIKEIEGAAVPHAAGY
jgi:hypothetical protein